MTFGYYVNGEKREPTKEEIQIMTDRFMESLGLERADNKKTSHTPTKARD